MSINEVKLSETAEWIISALNKNGYEAYVVGGAVRDSLLSLPVSDYDVATSATPEEVERAFVGYKVLPTGIKHGTMTVVGKENIEITTFRRESGYSDFRRPDGVEFVGSFKEDCARRDFTVNALGYNPKEGIVDYYGGLDDLREKVIRTVGDPYERFKEDSLRILRAIRFCSTLGFKIESETERAIFALKGNLKFISAERVYAEITKLLCGKDAFSVLMKYAEVIFEIIPELALCYKFEQSIERHKFDVYEHIARAVGNISPKPLLRFTMLLHDAGKPKTFFIDSDGAGHFCGHAAASAKTAEKVLTRLKAPKNFKSDVCARVKLHDRRIKAEKTAVKEFLSEYGEELFFDLLEIRRADLLAKGTALIEGELKDLAELNKIGREIIDGGECYKLSQLKICGKDLTKIGFKGEEVGKNLNAILKEVICGNIPNDGEELLRFAQKRFLEKR